MTERAVWWRPWSWCLASGYVDGGLGVPRKVRCHLYRGHAEQHRAYLGFSVRRWR